MMHLKTYEEVRWFVRGKLGPEESIPGEPSKSEFIFITPDNIEVGLDVWHNGEKSGVITSLDNDQVTIYTAEKSKFICPLKMFYKYKFKTKKK